MVGCWGGGGGGGGGMVLWLILHNNDYKIGLILKRFLFNEKLSLLN